ncbi:MAG: hypothetical protein ED557_09115 [Balneola sp.]|nr:MAG: hypothetical protein ED557_09115 [Balneola sp.]
MKKLSTFLLFIAISPVLFGQGMEHHHSSHEGNLEVPETWEVRLDREMDDLHISSDEEQGHIYFVNMTPGWHITTGPAAIFWHPDSELSDTYTVQTSIYTLDPNGRHAEGFGLFFGGKDLKEDGHAYLYFLIRNSGDFLIKERIGDRTETIQGWTSSEAINRHTEAQETDSRIGSHAFNQLSVAVTGDHIDFYINEAKVASIDSDGYDTNGLFGLRINHAVDVHVSNIGEVK